MLDLIIINFVPDEVEKIPTYPGQIMTFEGTNIPDGFLPCDGRVLRRKNYPELYKIIRTKYGEMAGSNTVFKLPLMSCGRHNIRYIIYVGFKVATRLV